MSPTEYTPADEQFHTSSVYPIPQGYDAWKIRNDYPGRDFKTQSGGVITAPGQLPPGDEPTPWLDVDFKAHPIRYLELVKEYFLEGMLEADFVPQKNTIRQWYHAPWLHPGDSGREPIRGLTAEGVNQPFNLSGTQSESSANWANGFFNTPAASVLGKVWTNPNDPQTDCIRFPEGSVVIKTLFATASVEQIPSQRGAPEWKAAVAEKPESAQPRNDFASSLRLIQMDVATTNPKAPLGWIFGTFWYNGLRANDECGEEEPVRDKWNRLMPVGLMWGNDPELTQAKWEAGERPKESWVNPEATQLLKKLGAKRPFLGWNDRMNGPADGFISACLSCHAVAQVNVPPPEPSIVPPRPVEGPPGTFKPKDDKVTMQWFRNTPCGEPFTPGATSTDYNMQIRTGLKHYYDWRRSQAGGLSAEEERVGGKSVIGFPRSGPDITFF